MRLIPITILPLIAVLTLTACHKDGPNQPACPGTSESEGPCEPLPLPGGLLGWNYLLPNHKLRSAGFNPSNGDEIVITESSQAGQGTTMWKYQISSHTLTAILTVDELSDIGGTAWGSNGWILVTSGTNIFKVKANGDSLTQLTFLGGNISPQWSPSSAAFGYTYINNGPWVSVRTSTSTGISDTLYNTPIFQGSCWYTENQVVWANNLGVLLGDIAADAWTIVGPTPVASDPDNSNYFGITTMEQSAVWSHVSGLYRTDLANGTGTQLLLSTCDSHYFSGLDYSPQTDKLLSIRRRFTPQDSTTLLVENELVLMNPDGSGLQVLNLPFPE